MAALLPTLLNVENPKTKLFLYIGIKFEKNNIYSPSLHQNIYQKLIECFNNYIQTHKISNFLKDADTDSVNNKMATDKVFEKPDIEIETSRK